MTSNAQLEKEINTTLSKIPNILLEKAEKKGWSCRITNLRNLENEYGYDFKISGLTDYIRSQIVVYATFDGVHYALPHEMGHLLDQLLGNITDSDEWDDIYKKAKTNIKNKWQPEWHTKYNILQEKYFLDIENKKEFFADAFLLYCMDRPLLKETTSLCEIFDRAIEALEYMDECYIV